MSTPPTTSWARFTCPAPGQGRWGLAWLEVLGWHSVTQGVRGLGHHSLSSLFGKTPARLTANLQLMPHVPREGSPLFCKSACPQPNRWTGTARGQDLSIKA